MTYRHHFAITLLIAMSLAYMLAACSQDEGMAGQITLADTSSVREERVHIKAGNELFEQKKYDEAEIEYRKALEANPNSAPATFNLATALLYINNERTIVSADSLLLKLQNAPDVLLGFAHYDRGNTRYINEDYQTAIDFYKEALRKNPNDDWARYNLRMAQLKLQEQQEQQNQQQPQGGGNNDQQDEQDKKDQQQDQQQEQQQDQQKDKDQQKQDQGQNDNDKSKGQPQNAEQRQGQPNSDQALNAVQQKENETKRRVDQRVGEQNNERRERTRKKW